MNPNTIEHEFLHAIGLYHTQVKLFENPKHLKGLSGAYVCVLVLVRGRQGGLWGFQYYRPPPHKTAIYRPIFNFSTVPFSPVKFFANTIETDNLENFLCTLYRD